MRPTRIYGCHIPIRGQLMRSKTSLALLALLATGLANVALAEFEEVREFTLETRGIDMLSIDAGAGSLDVVGEAGANRITVTATIQVPTDDEEKARKLIQSDLVLSLEKESDIAVLKSYFEQNGWNWGDSPVVHIEVRMPENLHLAVDDGSGSIEIENVRGDIGMDDGSGSLTMRNVGGEVDIEDGSGSISVTGVGGDISINDGSGSITVRGVAGSVVVDDGSGSIDVEDVEEDLIIVDDGSGGLDFSNIRGKVEKDS